MHRQVSYFYQNLKSSEATAPYLGVILHHLQSALKLNEQLKRILKAAPHLPVQTINGVIFLIAIPIFIYLGIAELITWKKWIEIKATPMEIGELEYRWVNDEWEYYHHVKYLYIFDNDSLDIDKTIAYYSETRAEMAIRNLRSYRPTTSVWVNPKNPLDARVMKPTSFEILYFIAAFTLFGMLAYFRWLLLKYYELEIEQ